VNSGAVDHYARLGLARDATARQVARAFRHAARTAHPDAGGAAADFAALAEAHRVLSDPVDRAAYDRELDGVAVPWDDVGWGTEVDGGLAPGGQRGDTVSDDADAPWDEQRGDDDSNAATDGEPTTDPSRLDPFVGGPYRVPDPLAPRAVPMVPSLAAGAFETVAAVAAWALALTAAVLRVVSLSAATGIAAVTGAASSDESMSIVFSCAVYASIAILLHAKARGSRGMAVAWVATGVAAITWLATIGDGTWPIGVTVASVLTYIAALAVGIAWAWAFRTRRSDPAWASALRERDRGYLLDRYHRAVEWNRVRAALLEPGRTAVIVGTVAIDLAGTAQPGHRWTFDPRTGAETVRPIADDVPHGSWVVVDDAGLVVASAPAWAPQAWMEALRYT
jgi:hypothetical protein